MSATMGAPNKRGGSQADRNMAVITMDELQRIRQQCTGGFTNAGGSNTFNFLDEEAQRTQDRLNLHAVSQARIANWPNTMHALRKKREEDRIKRLEEEELERRRIDGIEFELQQAARMRVVERAKDYAEGQQDIVKAFKSKLLMSDVLAEREVQKAIKERKREHEKVLEREWEELDRAKMEAFDEKVKGKLVKEFERKQANTRAIKEQLQEFKQGYIKRLQDDKMEAQLIDRQVKEEMEREAEKERLRQIAREEQKEEFRRANKKLLEQQERDRQKEKEEERKIEEYARKKAALDQLKKDREDQKFQEKQATRQKLIEKQSAILASLKNKEDEILNKQVEEAEEKALRLFEEQERRRQELKEQIEKSRHQQLEKKRREKQAEEGEQQQFAAFWKLRNEELAIAEAQEKQEAKERSEDMKGYLRKQIEGRQKKAEEEYKQELAEAAKTQAMLDAQEKGFYSYAEKALKEWQEKGKNVTPIILELKNYKKKVF